MVRGRGYGAVAMRRFSLTLPPASPGQYPQAASVPGRHLKEMLSRGPYTPGQHRRYPGQFPLNPGRFPREKLSSLYPLVSLEISLRM